MLPMNTPTVSRPRLALIAAVAADGGIGLGNELLWHEPQDQRHFRLSTMGCPVIMGRKTWDSLPARFRPLPGRRNLVLTRQPQWQAPGAETCASLAQAIEAAEGSERVFVMGGAELYAQALPLADELWLTELSFSLPADAYFPTWRRADFEVTQQAALVDHAGRPFTITTYRRRPDGAAQ